MNNDEETNTELTGAEAPTAEVVHSRVVDGEVLGSDRVNEQLLSMPALDNISESRPVPASPRRASLPLEVMFDVPITLVFEVGRTNITIKQLMELREGSYIELRHISVDSIDVRINDKVIAQAETIAPPQRYGIRFGEVEMVSSLEIESASV